MDNDMKEMLRLIRKDLQENHGLDEKSIDVLFKQTEFLKTCEDDPEMIFHYSAESWSEDLLESFEKGQFVLYRRDFIKYTILELSKHYNLDIEKSTEMVEKFRLKELFNQYPEHLNHMFIDTLIKSIYDSQKSIIE